MILMVDKTARLFLKQIVYISEHHTGVQNNTGIHRRILEVELKYFIRSIIEVDATYFGSFWECIHKYE